MKLLILGALVAQLSGLQAVDVPTMPRLLGYTDSIPLPAFAELHLSEDDSKPVADRYTFYISTFKPLALGQTDSIFYLRSPGRYLDDIGNWSLSLLDKTSFWPNNPDFLPRSVVGFEGIAATSGFLVPTKTRGKLQLFDMNAEDPNSTQINIASADERDYSYHRVIWKDMDGDGDLDAVTARFHNTVQEQNFLWLENPGEAVEGWTQHIMVEFGPDVHFRNLKIQSAGVLMDCFFAGELWHQRLSLHCIEDAAPGGWTDLNNIKSMTIDDTPGQCFDLLIEDMDLDGRLDLVLTAFNESIRSGKVFIYEIPDDLFNGEWISHIIAQDFVPTPGSNRMSPGTPKTYYPTLEYANEILPGGRHHKKWIMVSGDDDGHFYILRPSSEESGDWTYEKVDFLATGGITSGKMAIADLDNDGYAEVVAAGYSASRIFVYTYKP